MEPQQGPCDQSGTKIQGEIKREMKKILFYIDSLRRGGAQRVMSNLVTFFCESGYETVLVNDFALQNDMHYDVPSEAKRIYLRPDNSGNALIKNIVRVTKLRKVIKEEKPDIVLSFMGRPNKRMLMATIGLDLKTIVSVRNDPNKEYGASKIKKYTAHQIFKLADGVVFQTEDAAEYFPEKIKNKSAIIFNPVGETFYTAVRSALPCDIVTTGRLEPQKNHKMLIDAFSRIADKCRDDLYIYGEGPLRQELEELCVRLGVSDRVHLPGNTSDVKGVLEKANIYVLSSDYEGMPNALMEAMAVGVPAISTDCPCGGPKMLIKPGEEGLLVPCNDADALAKAMLALEQDDDKREEMGCRAAARAKDFLPSIIYKQWEEFFKHVFEH